MATLKHKDVAVNYEVELVDVKGDACLLKAFQLEGSSEVFISIDSFGSFPRKELPHA